MEKNLHEGLGQFCSQNAKNKRKTKIAKDPLKIPIDTMLTVAKLSWYIKKELPKFKYSCVPLLMPPPLMSPLQKKKKFKETNIFF